MKSKAGQTRAWLLDAAMADAREHGYTNMNRERIARRAGCATGLVTTRLGTMAKLQREVMRAAVTRGDARIVLQGLAVRDRHALKAPPELQAAARGLIE